MTEGVMTMDGMYRYAIRVVGAGALVGAMLLVGCATPGPSSNATDPGTAGTVASEASVANVRRGGFLTDYTRLRPMPGGGGLLCWCSAGTDWKQYSKVMF